MSHKSFPDPHGTSDRARQGLLDNRCEHATKRHRTRKRSKVRSAKKRSATKHANAVMAAKRRRRAGQALAYWRGENVDHPK